MKTWKLLPKMAVKGIISNKMVYYPYLLAGIFSAFAYFVFSSILHNDLIAILPRSAYAWILLEIGKLLLGIILFFFLIYAGSFVFKRRKKEIGLYSLLGLEKKHIGMMLFLETMITYGVMMVGGIMLGVVCSKLFFLLLLKLSHLPVDAEFVFTLEAFGETLFYFGAVLMLHFVNQIWELGKSRPAGLLSESRKGEKEPKLLFVWSIIGVVVLGFGYCIAIRSEVDSMIFMNFFLAVFLVIIGTYLVFTSGSVAFLKLIRRNKKVYYRPANFITISGMFYRMKKNAAGLVNICIFSTMVIITLICTVSLYLGMEDITSYVYPYDITADFAEGSLTAGQIESKLAELEEKYSIALQRADFYDYIALPCLKEENSFGLIVPSSNSYYDKNYAVQIITLETYNRITGENEELSEQEVLMYSSGVDFGYDTLKFMGLDISVKKEVKDFFPYPKAVQNAFNEEYVIIVRDETVRDAFVRVWAEQNGVEDMEAFLNSGSRKTGILLEGEEEERSAFIDEFARWCRGQTGFKADRDGLEGREGLRSMYGGLLFIGMIFGLVFFLCLIIIMYYKQISEGYEDQGSFGIMQKVGMSDEEIKITIHRQILLVFGLPLFGALMHTIAGMFMVERLMVVIQFFNTHLMVGCLIGVAAVFVLLYGISYLTTAKTYYRIVKAE